MDPRYPVLSALADGIDPVDGARQFGLMTRTMNELLHAVAAQTVLQRTVARVQPLDHSRWRPHSSLWADLRRP